MRLVFPFAVFVFNLSGCLSNPFFRWIEGVNCPSEKGRVTDKYCCNDEKFCSAFNTEKACIERSAGAPNHCDWRRGKCLPRVDSGSDVCCVKGTVGGVCHSLLRGECPVDWQVDEQCCASAAARKYSWLKTNEGKVCCNAPCMEAEKSGCPNLPPMCGPSQRSWAMVKPHQALGFNFGSESEDVLRGFQFGNVLSGTGFRGDKPAYASVGQEKYGRYEGSDFSKDKHVEEITVDDVMLLLIEAFEKDSDVKLYDSDISSDPYLGKTKSGGLAVDHRFPDADDFLDRIYGQSNFGQSANGQPGYGPPAYGSPAYGSPAYGPPAYGPPAYGPPAYGPPAYGPPAYGPPAYGPPAYGPPAYGPPAYGPPAYGPPSYGPPAYGNPAYGTSAPSSFLNKPW